MIKNIIVVWFFILGLNGSLYANTAEDNAVKISTIVTQSLAKVGMDQVKANTLGILTKKLLGNISNHLIANYFSDELYKKTQSYIASTLTDGSFQRMLNTRITKTFGTEILWVVGDIVIELSKNSIDMYSKFEPRYNIALKWWIDIGYTDVKALMNPNKLVAGFDIVVGNGKVLKEMSIAIYDTLYELEVLEWNLYYTQAFGKIIIKQHELQKEYSKAVYKSQKESILRRFNDYVLSFRKDVGDNSWLEYFQGREHLNAYNSKISFLAIDGKIKMQEFNRNKLFVIEFLAKDGDKNKYDTFVNNFFILQDSIYLKRFFISQNFNPKLQTFWGEVSYKYMQKAEMYGFTPFDFTFDENRFYRPNRLADMLLTTKLINEGCGKFSGSSHIYTGNMSSGIPISRLDVAKSINKICSIDQRISEKMKTTYKKRIDKLATEGKIKGWYWDAAILKFFKIVNGSREGNIIDFRPNDNATAFEVLVMLINTMNYKTCGKVDCSNNAINQLFTRSN